MKVHDNRTPHLQGSVVAIGAFDGMHLGHQAVICKAVHASKIYQVPGVVYTFDPPPRAYFQNATVLMSVDEKIEYLRKFGVEQVVIARFNEDYTQKSADRFVKELHNMHPREVLAGNNFRFGRGRSGSVELLKQYFNVNIVKPVRCMKGEVISSTRIRQLIARGQTQEVGALLGEKEGVKG
ncbi:riboflavin kinase/FMN adenylyltransferase [Alteribacillus persepolensis]|uniref:FAD synthase n=1 Tax=Alteribacillus persepolensis TaxID=568899 RepID=A0A1G8J887_9BACI|nr:FAD synthetase family protein [Alteribacillus persepolensis]SDI27464.1 riboflavin kinase/FMN adenylyltransferase [Alteribacillus persepolensis]